MPAEMKSVAVDCNLNDVVCMGKLGVSQCGKINSALAQCYKNKKTILSQGKLRDAAAVLFLHSLQV